VGPRHDQGPTACATGRSADAAAPSVGGDPLEGRKSSGQQRVLALFPGALGDLLCCWPALAGWRRATHTTLTLATHEAWFDALPENAFTALSIDRREIADLFGSAALHDSTRALFANFVRIESWTGHGDETFVHRLRDASDAAVAVHPFCALRSGEHASDYYARCLRAPQCLDRLPVRRAAAEWAAALWDRHRLGRNVLVIHPGSGSVRKNWAGMGEVASLWRRGGGAVIVVSGPAEGYGALSATGDVAVHCESLDRVAALLARGTMYLGNDSGVSHLAALVGARGVSLFGPSDPVAWRPRGGIRVLHAPRACARCGADRFCVHRLPVDEVFATLQAN
jgi:Glycosyltransferase family 9 (heptosyltransferase)